jgi:formylglycine-generating enzyme required for sulfatase activity
MKIFISYRRAEDKKSNIVWTIHEKLAQAFGVENVFRDTEDIHGGAKWRLVLEREVNSCKVMVVVIGPDWANLRNPDGQKRLDDVNDVTRWEVETGLRRSREEGVTVIPVRVLSAQIPKKEDLPESLYQLFDFQWKELQNSHFDVDMQDLISDIRRSRGYAEEDIITQDFEPKTIYIAEGPFWMGSDAEDVKPYEMPAHEVFLSAYRIGKYPTTNREYQEYLHQTGTRVSPIIWNGERALPEGLGDHPVTGVTWDEAMAYCRWLSTATGRKYSLPSEAQWEKACRGGNSCLYPWGDEFDAQRCNQGRPAVASVTTYPAQSDFGCFDLVGNVLQWTRTLWGKSPDLPDAKYFFPYPQKDDERNDPHPRPGVRRVIRGSSMSDDKRWCRCSARRGADPSLPGVRGARNSFRVVMSI